MSGRGIRLARHLARGSGVGGEVRQGQRAVSDVQLRIARPSDGAKTSSSAYGPNAGYITAGMMLRMQSASMQSRNALAPLAVSESTSVSQSVHMMVHHGASALLTLSDGESNDAEVTGILTQRDYLRKVVLQGHTSSDLHARDIASRALVCAVPSSSLDDMLRLFVEQYTQHVPVVAKDAGPHSPLRYGQVHGILTMSDTAWVLWSVLSQSREQQMSHQPDAGTRTPVSSQQQQAENSLSRVADMTVEEVLQMSHPQGELAYTIGPDDTVFQALQLMERHKIGALIVRDQGESTALITELDYLYEVHVKGRRSENTLVRDIMTSNPRCITLDASVDAALKEMVVVRFTVSSLFRCFALVSFTLQKSSSQRCDQQSN